MKYLLGTAGLILVIGLTSWLYISKNESGQNLEGKDAVQAASHVKVTPLSADVSISLDLNEGSVITEPKDVSDGSTVKTSADGRAIIANDESIISSLDNNSEITLALSDGKKKSSMALIKGRVWSKIARALEQDEVFEVYTPTMVAAARGTSFGVSLDKKRTLIVIEGIVYVVRRDPQTGERIIGSGIEVPAGNTLEDDGVNFTLHISSPQDKDDWYNEHNLVVETEQVSSTKAPVSNNTNPNPATNPVNNPVTATTNGIPVTVGPPSIASVSPDRFDYETESNIRISGDNLSSATELLFNGLPVEFTVTNTGLLVVSTSELRDGYDTYDVKVTTPTGTDTRINAFENEFQGVNLSIREAVLEYGQTQNTYIAIRGVGMDAVDTVILDGQILPFILISSTELNVDYNYTSGSIPVEIRAGNQSATGTVSI